MHLPSDVLGLIATHLPPQSVAALSATSHQHHQAFTNGRANVIWSAKLLLHFPQASATLMRQPANQYQAAFATAFNQYYGKFDMRIRWLLTLAAEGDVSGLTEGGWLYVAPRKRWFYPLGDAVPTKFERVTLDEMLEWHDASHDSISVVSVASRQSHQLILDHGYTLAQARFAVRGAAAVMGKQSTFNERWLLIHYATCMNQPKDTIVALLAMGANVNALFGMGATPLFLAAQQGHAECVQTLLAAGATVDAATPDNWHPLYIAAYNGHTKCVQHLLEAGLDVNLISRGRETALFYAAKQGHANCVGFLLAAGAVDDLASLTGETPFAVAMNRGHYHVALHLYAAQIASQDDQADLPSVPSFFGRFFSRTCLSTGEKKRAAQALLSVVNGEAKSEMLTTHPAALSNGALGQIAKALGYHAQSNGNVMHRSGL
tara:strand:+ start:123 stop:1418 length:1296 start_codon:yes stop_codon:yes gene_type:complete